MEQILLEKYMYKKNFQIGIILFSLFAVFIIKYLTISFLDTFIFSFISAGIILTYKIDRIKKEYGSGKNFGYTDIYKHVPFKPMMRNYFNIGTFSIKKWDKYTPWEILAAFAAAALSFLNSNETILILFNIPFVILETFLIYRFYSYNMFRPVKEQDLDDNN